VLDNKPRNFTPEERETLRILGRQVMSQLELRRSLRELTMMNRKALALESILRRYTSRSIWERGDVSASRGALKDEVRNHACLFLDVVGFTRYAETHTAEEVVQILNDYFNPIVECIHECG
jgi:adenylate cyclase